LTKGRIATFSRRFVAGRWRFLCDQCDHSILIGECRSGRFHTICRCVCRECQAMQVDGNEVYADAGGPGIFRSSPASGDPVEAWWRRDPAKGWSQIFVSLAAAPAGGKSSGGKDSGNGWSSGGKGLSSESGDQVERRRREYRRWWNETLIDARKKDIEELQHQIEAKKEEIEFLKGQIEVER